MEKNIKFKKINNKFFELNKLSGQALHTKTLGLSDTENGLA